MDRRHPECARESPRRGVGLWNARLAREAEPLFVPTVAAAVRAGRPWVEFQCRACGMIGEVDLRKFDRHQRAMLNRSHSPDDVPALPDGVLKLRRLFP